MNRYTGSVLAGYLSFLLCSSSWADVTSPVGVWKTIDDDTGKPRSVVVITEANGALQGRIEQMFLRPDEKTDRVCDLCEDERKNKPIIGMNIMGGYRKSAESEWTDGIILDPDNGKTYKSNITLIEGGKKLRVRGYIGIPLIGRTQIWLREQTPQ